MKLFALAIAIALLALPVQAYVDQSFSVHVKVDDSGNARITEKAVFLLENEAEKNTFEYYLGLGRTTLFDWQRFSKNIGYHFSGSVSDLKIVATREYQIHPNSASVTLEYNAENVMFFQKTTSRVTEYEFKSGLIALTSAKGEISLGNGMSFTLELPPDAENINVSPDPGSGKRGTTITWNGPILGIWDVSYIRENSLSQEVNEFFAKTLEDVKANYLWFLLVLFALVLVFKFIQKPEE